MERDRKSLFIEWSKLTSKFIWGEFREYKGFKGNKEVIYEHEPCEKLSDVNRLISENITQRTYKPETEKIILEYTLREKINIYYIWINKLKGGKSVDENKLLILLERTNKIISGMINYDGLSAATSSYSKKFISYDKETIKQIKASIDKDKDSFRKSAIKSVHILSQFL